MRQPSRQQILALALCSAVCLISAVPVPQPAGNQELDVLQIPLANGKEIDVLTLGAKDQEQLIADRNKRTIGLLRELFPDITKNGATDTQIDLSAINKQLEETIRVARQVKEAEAAAAASQSSPVAQAPIPLKSNEPIQLSFNNELPTLSTSSGTSSSSSPTASLSDVKALSTNDLQQSESKSPAIDELTLDSAEETAELDDRNKRFLNFGGAGLAGGSSGNGAGGSPSGNSLGAGGSGNFLLDVVRLFSGSVQTQQGDEAANSVGGGGASSSGLGGGSLGSDDTDGDSTRNADGYTEGIPGPVTRLVVLANRGLANLVQDLILRVAATSEKFVNFKAKLITALI
ncbi:keratin, type I cytoskeletal 10 isoform X2 [Drosophila miranda]|uniref:Keratin, type I cytoskeletal 10 isoform X2 n=1 Tax=Drosophila pseudoobscura pseudoobscura TaxID=46245 RepID=A0A0R3P6X7_DROPS|nr:keratin, type I cytoskeletal 10 isoform X2 [Drosophila pseudoobscura]XP_017156449.1 keratin, type I cytoskeletal 10 isoform X2 [Drosophila miranda]XP_026846971.1 keratin, type I cytoskeletal 10 isoform X2 [Drosophila persimilis]